MISNELPTNPEQPSDFAGPAAARPPQDKQDPKSEVPVVPVLREELIALRLRFDAFRIVSNASVRVLARNESRADEHRNVVDHGPMSELKHPRNRPEVVAREHQQMSVDTPAGRMVEAVSAHPAIHHHFDLHSFASPPPVATVRIKACSALPRPKTRKPMQGMRGPPYEPSPYSRS